MNCPLCADLLKCLSCKVPVDLSGEMTLNKNLVAVANTMYELLKECVLNGPSEDYRERASVFIERINGG